MVKTRKLSLKINYSGDLFGILCTLIPKTLNI